MLLQVGKCNYVDNCSLNMIPINMTMVIFLCILFIVNCKFEVFCVETMGLWGPEAHSLECSHDQRAFTSDKE